MKRKASSLLPLLTTTITFSFTFPSWALASPLSFWATLPRFYVLVVSVIFAKSIKIIWASALAELSQFFSSFHLFSLNPSVWIFNQLISGIFFKQNHIASKCFTAFPKAFVAHFRFIWFSIIEWKSGRINFLFFGERIFHFSGCALRFTRAPSLFPSDFDQILFSDYNAKPQAL